MQAEVLPGKEALGLNTVCVWWWVEGGGGGGGQPGSVGTGAWD